MPLISLFALSFTIALSGALAPGPLLAAVLFQSGHHGPKTGPLVILGHALLEISLVGLIVLGLSRLDLPPPVFKTVSWLGAAILAYCGADMLRSLPAAAPDSSARPNISPARLPVLGIALSLANPYWVIWWLTVGIGLVLGAQRLGPAGIIVFLCGHICADLAWYSFVSLSMSKGRKYISGRLYRGILAVCGWLLIGFGVYFAVRAMTA